MIDGGVLAEVAGVTTCSDCGQGHAGDVMCDTFVRQGSGTQAMPSKDSEVAAPNGRDPMIGMTVGSFRIVKMIGRGGMGAVYLGEQAVIGSKVAIKILHDHLASNASLVSRFYAEARAVNLIGHENIVNIFYMNVLPPHRYYLIMELLEGRPLGALAQGPVAPEIFVPILTQVCEALEAAHGRGVVHRDLKPENIFLIKRGRNENFVKILDFGIAKLFGVGSTGDVTGEPTGAGTIVGTPEYMAPEQCTGAEMDGRTDLYSLGVIAYQLSTGRLPFAGGGLAGLLVAHQSRVPTPPHVVNPNVPLGLSLAIMRALEKKPEARFQTAGQFAAGLELAVPPMGKAGRGFVATVIAAPPVVEPAPRPDARHKVSFDAHVSTLDGKALGPLKCHDLSKGGCFLCSDRAPPAIGTRLKIVLPIAGGLECVGEVVRHVLGEQAAAWGMSPGFGVQFAALGPEQKAAVSRVVQGLPLQPPPPLLQNSDDPSAEQVLRPYRPRLSGDPYLVLGLTPDAELSEVRARGREATRALEALRERPLSVNQKTELEATLLKIRAAVETLGTAHNRLPLDAHRGNFKGVARCIAAGLTVTELDLLRANFLRTHDGAELKAFSKFLAGKALEDQQSPRALELYEEALALDPMNLSFQKRYWALKHRTQTA
jgi:serine/threonine protein kinase